MRIIVDLKELMTAYPKRGSGRVSIIDFALVIVPDSLQVFVRNIVLNSFHHLRGD